MNTLTLILRELFGMFVDDEFLAIAVLAVVALAAGLAFWLVVEPLVAGAVLLFVCIGVVAASAYNASRRDGPNV